MLSTPASEVFFQPSGQACIQPHAQQKGDSDNSHIGETLKVRGGIPDAYQKEQQQEEGVDFQAHGMGGNDSTMSVKEQTSTYAAGSLRSRQTHGVVGLEGAPRWGPWRQPGAMRSLTHSSRMFSASC